MDLLLSSRMGAIALCSYYLKCGSKLEDVSLEARKSLSAASDGGREIVIAQ